MDFSKLPDNVFMQILSYLPFEKSIGIGRVDKSFQRMSMVVISRTKRLNFAYRPNNPRHLTPRALAGILQLCHDQLESITFASHYDFCNPALLATLGTFSCPNLTFLDIGNAEIGIEIFDPLLRKLSNIKTLCLDKLLWSEYNYPDVTCPKLETINAYVCYEMHIRSIANSSPSLKHFKTCIPVRVSPHAWDTMFAYCPNLETFHLSTGHGGNFTLNLTPSAPFWELRLLRVLGLNTCGHNVDENNVLIRLSASFPNLEVLYVYPSNNLTSLGISALGQLKNLRKLWIGVVYSASDMNEGISQLANCTKLEEFYAYTQVSSHTFLNLIRSCYRLRMLHVGDVKDIDSNDAAVALVQAIGALSATRLTKLCVRLHWLNSNSKAYDYWMSQAAKDALSELKVDGQMIEFDMNDDGDSRYEKPWWARMD